MEHELLNNCVTHISVKIISAHKYSIPIRCKLTTISDKWQGHEEVKVTLKVNDNINYSSDKFKKGKHSTKTRVVLRGMRLQVHPTSLKTFDKLLSCSTRLPVPELLSRYDDLSKND